MASRNPLGRRYDSYTPISRRGTLAVTLNFTVSVPISVSWATRTELIKEQDVGGQLGFTLDLDSFFQ